MNTKKNVCVVFRGELLRNTVSCFHNNIKNKQSKNIVLYKGIRLIRFR